MSDQSSRLQYLMRRNTSRACTREELSELYSLLAQSGDEEAFAVFDEQYQKIGLHAQTTDIDWKSMAAHITSLEQEPAPAMPVHRIHFLRRTWARYAAVVLLMAGTAAYLWFGQDKRQQAVDERQVAHKAGEPEKTSMLGNKAILTLADGTAILLDSAADGSLALQGNTSIVKLKSGELSYRSESQETTAVLLFNTITTPNGGEYQVRLSDGTRIWLNAASQLRYPSAFAKDSRMVELSGEAYFEVAKDAARPFYVKASGMTVEVLGTHFNINSYSDEPVIHTTLIEGAVKISTPSSNALLKPGQQASINQSATGQAKISVQSINTELAIAWQKGYFYFDRADIKTVMRQLARWYDVTVDYEGEIPSRRFMGEIQKNLKLSELLVNLEMIGIRSKLEGKRLVVLK